MKKIYLIALITTALGVMLTGGVYAATTPVAESVTVGTNGVATWTNARDYVAFNLVSIEAFQAGSADSTCTVTRVRSGRTNTVGSVVISSSAGTYNETNTIYFFPDDTLTFTMDPLTNCEFEITGKLLP